VRKSNRVIKVLEQVGYFPHSCVWELTLACNLRCKHCGSIAGRERSAELSLDECLRIAGELVAMGCQNITLIGGEPTLFPGWHQVGRRLVELGAQVNTISNGWIWSPEHVQLAKAAGFCAVSFSLDGLQAEHDAFRARGSFERVMRAIDITVEGGMRAGVNTTIHRLNRRFLPQLRELLLSHGVFGWQLQLATPSGNMGEHRDLLLPPEDLLWLVPQVAEMCRIPCPELEIYVGHNIGYFGSPESALRAADVALPFWLGCRAGCQVIGIESGGDVKGCLSLPSSVHGETRFVEGNLREHSLREIWNRPGAFAYNRHFKEEQLGGFCRVCRYRDVCRGGCSWGVYAHEGSGNERCFYYQAVKHGRSDLLAEAPTAEESEYWKGISPGSTWSR
jgi:radical SAM protein with 4Fe4S-binding SPASM domain